MSVSHEQSVPDCFDALVGLDDAVRSELLPGQKYVVVGGVVTDALMHENSWYDHATDTLVATDMAAAKPIIRENGTRRDVDVVILDHISDERKDRVKHAIGESVRNAVGQKMVVSVFAFEKRKKLDVVNRVVSTLRNWTSDRTIDEDGVLRYEMYPLEVVVNPESYEKLSTLRLPNGVEVPIFYPTGHILAYDMRSISSRRFKDMKKVPEMEKRAYADPVFKEAAETGIFKEWRLFAEGLKKLREGTLSKDSPLVRKGVHPSELEIAKAKSKGYGWIESQQQVVDFAQKESVQKVLNLIVRSA